MTTRSAIIINNTEYIPAKEAEMTFLIALVGIVTGIIFGFFVLKLNFSAQAANRSLPQSIPATYEESVPLQYPEVPIYNFGQEDNAQGIRDYTV